MYKYVKNTKDILKEISKKKQETKRSTVLITI